jgi:Na+-translocating ferredoxin:NAD+ oxidoreductase subunit D
MSKKGQPTLLLSTSPFLKQGNGTEWIMWQVNFSLVPIVLASVYFFGAGVLLVTAACTAGALLPEWLAARTKGRNTLPDGSAVITGVLLALTLPPSVPLWMAFTGGAAGITLGKLIFGGLGFSIFNPALVGRAFLQAAFPVAMTTWSPASRGFLTFEPATFATPFLQSGIDAVSEATPLAQMKFENELPVVYDLLMGSTAGSLGETSALLILAGGLYLAARRVLNWRIPLAIFASVFVMAGLLHLANPAEYEAPWYHLLSGGLMLGAIYMATDPVTSPITQRGCWLFGAGIGILVVVIRSFGGLPEGVMYGILLMNAMTPLINRATQPRTFGTEKAVWWRG